MNLHLHGIGGDKVVVHSGHDSLSAPWNREYSMILANPPFGKSQSLLFVNEEGDTQKQSPITRGDFDEFVACYRPGAIHKRKPTWTEEKPDGRWRCFGYDELIKRDKLSLDLFWIKDQSLTDTDSLPAPDILAIEIADELQTVVDLFSRIAAKLPKSSV